MAKINQKFWREQFEKDFKEEHKKKTVTYNKNYVLWLEKNICDLYEKIELTSEDPKNEKFISHFLPSLSESDLIPDKLKHDFINHMLETIEALVDSTPEDWTNHNRFRVKTSLITRLNEFENKIKESLSNKNTQNV